jgi:hypothetical protein
MAIYAQAFSTSANADLGIVADIKSAATSNLSVREIAVTVNTAVSPLLSLRRSITEFLQIDPRQFQPEERGDVPSLSTMATVWSNSPSLATAFLRRTTNVLGPGSGVIWSFPRGLWVPPSTSLAIGGNSLTGYSLSVEIEE